MNPKVNTVPTDEQLYAMRDLERLARKFPDAAHAIDLILNMLRRQIHTDNLSPWNPEHGPQH